MTKLKFPYISIYWPMPIVASGFTEGERESSVLQHVKFEMLNRLHQMKAEIKKKSYFLKYGFGRLVQTYKRLQQSWSIPLKQTLWQPHFLGH